MNTHPTLIINLGSPNDPTPQKVKDYLDEFLMDEYVIDFPYFLRWLLVKGIILNTRPKKSAEAYSEIWTSEGSPLVVYTQKVLNKLNESCSSPVYMAMRYGQPAIQHQIQSIVNEHPNAQRLFVIPLYPQYAMSTTKTVIEKVKQSIQTVAPHLAIDMLPPFFDNMDYLTIMNQSMKPFLEKDYDHLIFSFHGLPERHLKKTDPTQSHCLKVENCCKVKNEAHDTCYRHQCVVVAENIIEYFNIPSDKATIAFQSRLGFDPWLTPATSDIVNKLAKQGLKKVLVACPAFVSDCLETLEEIGMGLKEEFEENGGGELSLIPCLNDSDSWCNLLLQWINDYNKESLKVDHIK